MPVRIAIAEDNSFALRACLDRIKLYPDLKVVLTAFDGEELIGQIDRQVVDVVLMDIMMPGMGGIAATRIVKQKHPQLKVIMLTTFDDDQNIFEAILAGASGYLLKEESAEMLNSAILDTLEGGAAMSAGIALKVLNLLRNPLDPQHEKPQDFNLTSREVEILEQLKNGLNYEKIGENLFISYGTVRKHIQNIYRKLQVNNKVSAIDKATKSRII